MKGNYLSDFNRQSNLLSQSQAEDSLDDFQQQPKQYIVPAPHLSNNNQHIELTFKKSNIGQNFSYSNEDKARRSLFTQSERFLIKNLQHPITSYYQISIDKLSRLPFADLYSLQLHEKEKQKLVIVGDILQLRRVRMKAKIARVNQNCLSLKQNMSYQQKNKLFLLDLLVKQLTKKQLILTLRLNLKIRKFGKQFGDETNKEQQFSNPEIYQHSVQKADFEESQENTKRQLSYQQLKSQLDQDLPRDDHEIDKSSIRDKIWIMSQTLSSVVMKTVFWSFNSISNFSKKSQKAVIPKLPSNSFQISPIKQFTKQVSIKSQQLISQQRSQIQLNALTQKGISNQEIQENEEQAEEVAYSQAQNEEESISQTRIQLQRLQDYIDQLIEQCSETNDLQKRYFLKWKVYLLEKIAISILARANNYQQEQHYQYAQEESKQQQQQHSLKEENQVYLKSRNEKQEIHVEKNKTQLSIIQGWSRATSQLAEGYSGLKQQKNQFRTLLFKNRINQFLNLLKRNCEQNQIKAITKQVYAQKTLQKAFSALKNNLIDSHNLKQLDQYFQEVAQDQNQDIDLPFYFWKTSQLHKYFKLFKQNSRNIKAQKSFTSFTKRYAFTLLFFFSNKQLKQDEKIKKWIALKQKKGLFRFFNAWKQDYKSNYSYSPKVKSYIKSKEKEMLYYYFSVLKLEYKKHLVTMHRADKYYSLTLKKKIFREMIILTEDGQQFREKENLLAQTIYYRNASIFVENFTTYFQNYIQYQRLVVKQERLKKLISDNYIISCIKNWRATHLREIAYAAIEDKLIRLNKKKKKRQILKIWMKKVLQRNSPDSQKSDKHKQWLLKYYNGLCSVSPY